MKKIISATLAVVIAVAVMACATSGMVVSAEGIYYLTDNMSAVTFEIAGCNKGSNCSGQGIRIGSDDGTSYKSYSHGFMYQSTATSRKNGSITSWYSFIVPAGFNYFESRIGICYHVADNSGYNNLHRVKVFVNGTQKYISPKLIAKYGYDLSVAVKEGDKVEVEVYGYGSNTNGHVCFGDPRLVNENRPTATVKFNTDQPIVGEPVTAAVSDCTKQSHDHSVEWYLDDVKAGEGESYTPKEDDIGKTLKAVALCGGEKVGEATVYISNLPVMVINTKTGGDVTDKETYVESDMILYDTDKFSDNGEIVYDGIAKIRGRGNSSWTFRKKSYKLKLDKKTAFFDMEQSKHWLLIAGCYDETQMRNKIAYDFSGDIGMTYMQSQWVNLRLNGADLGMYLLCEQIRPAEGRVDIFDWESVGEDIAKAIAKKDETVDRDKLEDAMLSNLGWITSGKISFGGKTYKVADYCSEDLSDISGGYILQQEQDAAKEEAEDPTIFNTNYGLHIHVKSPEYAGTNAAMSDFLEEYVQAVENACLSDSYTASYNGKKVHYSELMDIDSLVKNFLCNEIFYNPDAGYNSDYMYISKGGKLVTGPAWDFDTACYGKGGAGTSAYNLWQVNISRQQNGKVMQSVWYKNLIKDPSFVKKVYITYHQYRDVLENYVKTGGLFDEYYDYLIKDCIHNSDMWRYKVSAQQDWYDIKNWIRNRVIWLDEQFKSYEKLYNSLNPSDKPVNALADVKTAEGDDIDLYAPIPYIQPLYIDFTATSQSVRFITVKVNGTAVGSAELNEKGIGSFVVTPEMMKTGTVNKIDFELKGTKNGSVLNISKYFVFRNKATENCKHSGKTAIAGYIAPTCGKEGYTGNVVCSECGKVVSTGEKIAKLEHGKKVIELPVPSTCVKKGHDGNVVCEDCKTVLYPGAVRPLEPHTYKTVTTAATYFAAGKKVTKCSVCGKVKSTVSIAKKTLKTPSAKLTAAKKALKVKVTKVTGQTGFQIRYRIKGKSKWTTQTYTGKATATKTIKLKSKKNYQVGVRAMVKKGSKKAYSSWSKTYQKKTK